MLPACDMSNTSTDVTSQGPDVFNAIRAVHKTTPILIFGGKFEVLISFMKMAKSLIPGHSHIRDCGKTLCFKG